MKPNQKRTDLGLWWDKAWTLVEGCTPVSAGCRHCWAAAQTHMRSNQSNPKIRDRYEGLTNKNGTFAGKVRLMESALDIPLRAKPKVWAIWNDLFHPDVPDEFIDKAFKRMVAAPQHLFPILTKRPGRMFMFMDDCWVFNHGVPKNIWLGTSVENQNYIDRIGPLINTPAAKHFVSLEPLLTPIKMNQKEMVGQSCQHLDLVIVGAESGPKRRPCNIEWVRKIVQDCKAAGVPVWVKQIHDKNGKVVHKLEEFPEDLRLRQWPE